MRLTLAFATLTLFQGQDLTTHTKLDAPGVEYRMNQASATRAPWIHSNAWRIRRNPHGQFWAEIPEGRLVLAMAEAHAFGANVVFKAAPSDKTAFHQMSDFLKTIERPGMKPLVNLVVEDDGSAMAGEALNLLARRNLLFRVGNQVSRGEMHVKATSNIKNPYDFSQEVRAKLTDQRRILRVFGSEVVLANLTGSGSRLRVHLVNYGRRPLEGLRIRVLGEFKVEKLAAFQAPDFRAEDVLVEANATEFSVPRLPIYAVVDLVGRYPPK